MEKEAVIIIDVFLNSQTRIEIFQNVLKSIKKLNLPIILTSNYEVPQNILKEVDYFIYSKEDLLFSDSYEEYPGVHFFMELDYMRYENHTYCSQKHGLSVLVNLNKSYRFAEEIGFKKAIKIEWDFIISENDFCYWKSKIDDFLINDKRAFFVLNPSNCSGFKDIEGHFWIVDLKFWNQNFPKIYNENDYKRCLLKFNGNDKFFEIVERIMYLSIGTQLKKEETITPDEFFENLKTSKINAIISDNNFILPSSDGICRGLAKIKRDEKCTGEIVLFTWNRSSDKTDNKSYSIKFNNKTINLTHSVQPGHWSYNHIPFNINEFPISLQMEDLFYKQYNSLNDIWCDLIFLNNEKQ